MPYLPVVCPPLQEREREDRQDDPGPDLAVDVLEPRLPGERFPARRELFRRRDLRFPLVEEIDREPHEPVLAPRRLVKADLFGLREHLARRVRFPAGRGGDHGPAQRRQRYDRSRAVERHGAQRVEVPRVLQEVREEDGERGPQGPVGVLEAERQDAAEGAAGLLRQEDQGRAAGGPGQDAPPGFRGDFLRPREVDVVEPHRSEERVLLSPVDQLGEFQLALADVAFQVPVGRDDQEVRIGKVGGDLAVADHEVPAPRGEILGGGEVHVGQRLEHALQERVGGPEHGHANLVGGPEERAHGVVRGERVAGVQPDLHLARREPFLEEEGRLGARAELDLARADEPLLEEQADEGLPVLRSEVPEGHEDLVGIPAVVELAPLLHLRQRAGRRGPHVHPRDPQVLRRLARADEGELDAHAGKRRVRAVAQEDDLRLAPLLQRGLGEDDRFAEVGRGVPGLHVFQDPAERRAVGGEPLADPGAATRRDDHHLAGLRGAADIVRDLQRPLPRALETAPPVPFLRLHARREVDDEGERAALDLRGLERRPGDGQRQEAENEELEEEEEVALELLERGRGLDVVDNLLPQDRARDRPLVPLHLQDVEQHQRDGESQEAQSRGVQEGHGIDSGFWILDLG